MMGPALPRARRARAAQGRGRRARPRPGGAHGRHARDPAHLSGRARDPRAPDLPRAARGRDPAAAARCSPTPAGSLTGHRDPPGREDRRGPVRRPRHRRRDRRDGRDRRPRHPAPGRHARRHRLRRGQAAPDGRGQRHRWAPARSCSGPITVGHGAKVGANSVVIHDVPPNTTVVGIPGHPVRVEGRKPEGPDTDWLHLPDPVADALRGLAERIGRLERAVAELTGQEHGSPPRSARCAATRARTRSAGRARLPCRSARRRSETCQGASAAARAPEPAAARGRHARHRARCSCWPAPAPARPAC